MQIIGGKKYSTAHSNDKPLKMQPVIVLKLIAYIEQKCKQIQSLFGCITVLHFSCSLSRNRISVNQALQT